MPSIRGNFKNLMVPKKRKKKMGHGRGKR